MIVALLKLVRYPSFSPFASAYSLYNASVLDKLDTSWRLYFAVAAMTVVGRIPPIVPMHMRHVMIAAMIRWRISFVLLFISLLLVLSSITTAILLFFLSPFRRPHGGLIVFPLFFMVFGSSLLFVLLPLADSHPYLPYQHCLYHPPFIAP